MARSKPPSMDFYPDDYVSGTLGMTPAARGIYMHLICYQWSNGSIPNPCKNNGKAIAFDTVSKRFFCQISGATETELDEHLEEALSKFEEDENGNLVNRRTSSEYAKKIDIRTKRSQSGSKGGRPKANGKQKKTKTGSGSRKKEVGSKREKESLSVTDAKSVSVPRELDQALFVEAWHAWIDHKQASDKPWATTNGPKAQLTRLKSHTLDSVIAGIWNAISEDWEGIWPDRVPASKAADGRKTFTQMAEDKNREVMSEELPPELREAAT